MFNDLSTIHHNHTVRDAGHDTKIVGDPDYGHAKALLKLFHQLKNLRLDGHVQRRCRFVRDQNLRITGQRNRYHHALAHAAGKLVRVIFQTLWCVRNTDKFEKFLRTYGCLFFGHPHVLAQGFHDLHADVVNGVQRRHRVLKHKPDLATTHPAQSFGVNLQQVLPVKHHRASTNIGRRRGQQAQQGHHGDGFARTTLPDNAQKLARFEIKAHVINRVDFPTANFEYCF